MYMATQISQKEALKRWKQLCETIQNFSTVNTAETKAEQMERISRARKDYAYFVEYYFPHYCTDSETGKVIPSAKHHIEAAKKILKRLSLIHISEPTRPY